MPLKRELGLRDAVGVGLGAIVGAGLFVVTGVAAGMAGPAFLIGLLVAAVAAACNALSTAQLAAEYPQAGGTYEYGYRVLNPWLGYIAGWTFLASKLAAGGTVALGFAYYATQFLPDDDVPVIPLALAAVAFLTFANLQGIRKTGMLNSVIVTITLGALLILVVGAAPAFDVARLQPFAPNGWDAVLPSAALLFFAFTGYARLATLGEEVRDPAVTIPRAIVIALVTATILYFAVSLVAVGVLGAEGMSNSKSPLMATAQASGKGMWLSALVSVAAMTAMLGVLLSQILGISRMAFAMSRRGDLPAVLSTVDAAGVPRVGVLATGAIIGVLALIGNLPGAAALASFAILLYYWIANLAALRQPSRMFPKAVPILGLVVCTLLAPQLPLKTIGIGLGVLAVGVLFRLVRMARQPGSA